MNKETFFKHYPKRKDDSNKFDNGRILIIGGSYGMAGSCIFNIIGANSVGSSYIDVYLPKDIYPIVASNQIGAIYHPNVFDDNSFIDLDAFKKAKAIAFGSGLSNLLDKEKYLELLLKEARVPLIIDAEGLNIISNHNNLLKLNDNIILTPHLGEFMRLTKLSKEEIENNKEEIAINYAKRNNVILILKGLHTLVIDNNGNLYKNDSGNSILARAGSGDILTGMITGLCSLYDNYYDACIDAVWLHGHLADNALKYYSKEVFDLSVYQFLANQFFMNN